MEAVGSIRIFERSLIKRNLQYTEYYGDSDSKGFLQVKDIYGENSVTKLECIGHIQKRVGSRLRKLKKNTKGLGGKGKLTDKFIDKLQNYYGIAVRSNVGCLEKMQSAVIAAFFHCCSSNQNPMHGQCPTVKDSWCKYKQALCDGKVYADKTAGLSNSVIKVINPTYLALYGQDTAKGTVANQFSECHRYTAVLQVVSNDDQRGPVVKRNGTLDHNSWLRVCVACNRKSRIGTLPWVSPDTSSMIVRTQLKVGFVAKYHMSPVSMIQT
ncbi:uncharacterized protein TNCV_1845851 [Trichonephila clavipes]|nr:uncharacterized protein TNCV_1845851 [Trichonephila clavipes]